MRSLNAAKDGIQDVINDTKPDIYNLQEIWTAPSYPTIPGYILVKTQRKKHQGGGVGMYIRDDLLYEEIQSPFKEKILETQGIKLTLNKKNIFIINCYLCFQEKEKCVKELTDFIHKYSKTNKIDNIVLTGDFNIDLSLQTNISSYLLDKMASIGILNTIFSPTRIAKTGDRVSATTIDNIFVKTDSRFKTNILTTGFSDHMTLAIDLDCGMEKRVTTNSIKVRNYSKQNMENFRKLVILDPPQISEDMDLNTMVRHLTGHLEKIIDNTCPIITIKGKKSCEWFSPWTCSIQEKIAKINTERHKKPFRD